MAVQDSILTAVTSAVSTATGLTATRREIGARWDTIDSLPVIFVVPGVERDMEDHFENTKFREYQVFVIAIYAGNKGFQTSQGTIPDIKHTIRQAVHKTSLTGVSEVWDTFLNPQPTFDTVGLRSNYERSIVEVWYRTTETRAA